MKGTTFLAILFLMVFTIFAINADQKGDEIAKKYHNLKKSDDLSSTTKMLLIDKSGNKQLRIIKSMTREGKNGTESFAEFLEPADVKGTKFLTLVEDNGENVQRLYLPALKKIRRISSSNKDGKFMGSDLCYYDMEDHDFEDFDFEFVSENETLNAKQFADMKFYKIKAIPKDKEAPYGYILLWINMDNNFAYQTIPYDKNGTPEKVIMILDVKVIDGVIIPIQTFVINQKENHKTLMTMEDIKLNSGLKSSIFEIQNLK